MYAGPLSRQIFSYIVAALVVLLAIYHLILEFYQMLYSIKTYFKDIRNYFELTLFFSCFFFVFNFANECGCPERWQWQIGIFVVFLGWIVLLFFASGLPGTAIYAIIFKDILITFLKLMTFAIFLVAGFSVVLFMMFYSPNATVCNCLSHTSTTLIHT